AEMVERSRERKKSDAMFDLEPGHTAEKPRLRRLSSPVEHHPVYWDFVVQSPIADIAADLVGPTFERMASLLAASICPHILNSLACVGCGKHVTSRNYSGRV